MSRTFIPVEEAFQEWRKDPEYVAAYDALEDEFTVASALIGARDDAETAQEQVVRAANTSFRLRKTNAARVSGPILAKVSARRSR